MIADDIDVNRPLDHFGPTWIFEEIFTIARAHTKLTQQKNYKALKTTGKQMQEKDEIKCSYIVKQTKCKITRLRCATKLENRNKTKQVQK